MPEHEDRSALDDDVAGSGVAQPEAGDRCALPSELGTLLQDLADILAELTGFSAVERGRPLSFLGKVRVRPPG